MNPDAQRARREELAVTLRRLESRRLFFREARRTGDLMFVLSLPEAERAAVAEKRLTKVMGGSK